MKMKENINGFNILVTEGNDKDVPVRDIYNSHMWIHNNTVEKNVTNIEHNVHNFITDSEIMDIKNLKIKV